MEVAYYGHGRVGALCRAVLDHLGVSIVDDLELSDLLISVHWPKIFTPSELALPKHGGVNLHNSYLPYNRGAHPCTWAIIDKTPHGATLHWMDEGIDTGDIIFQERLDPKRDETAHELYQRTVLAEVRVFREGMKMLLAGNHRHIPQPSGGSIHYKRDFDRLCRAMTTSDCRVIREA